MGLCFEYPKNENLFLLFYGSRSAQVQVKSIKEWNNIQL